MAKYQISLSFEIEADMEVANIEVTGSEQEIDAVFTASGIEASKRPEIATLSIKRITE